MADNARGALFRDVASDQHGRVTAVELFFDLVFVFAVTQVSHTLLHHFTPLGAIQTTMLFLAVWWVWVFTAWVTNWLISKQTPVRLLLFALMLAGLVLSTAISHVFESRGLWFAGAYAAMQVLLGQLFLLVVTPPERKGEHLNAARILAWLGASWRCSGFAAALPRARRGSGSGAWRSSSNICRP